MIVFCYLTQAQSLTFPLVDNGIRLTDKGFLLSKPTFVKYDFWARKGMETEKVLTETTLLINQISVAKLQSDSMTITLNKSLYNIKDEVNLEKEAKARTEGINSTLKIRIDEQDKEIHKLRTNLTWTVASAIGILVGTIFLLK